MIYARILTAIERALSDKAYMRKLVIRAIEDAAVWTALWIGVAGIGAIFTLLFRLLGVE